MTGAYLFMLWMELNQLAECTWCWYRNWYLGYVSTPLDQCLVNWLSPITEILQISIHPPTLSDSTFPLHNRNGWLQMWLLKLMTLAPVIGHTPRTLSTIFMCVQCTVALPTGPPFTNKSFRKFSPSLPFDPSPWICLIWPYISPSPWPRYFFYFPWSDACIPIFRSPFSLSEQTFLSPFRSHLKPGGWIEQIEMSVVPQSDCGTVTPENIFGQWGTVSLEAGDKFGRDLRIHEQMRGFIKEAGFENVVEKVYKWPIGPWPKDSHLKQLGLWNQLHWEEGIEGWSLALLTRVLGVWFLQIDGCWVESWS